MGDNLSKRGDSAWGRWSEEMRLSLGTEEGEEALDRISGKISLVHKGKMLNPERGKGENSSLFEGRRNAYGWKQCRDKKRPAETSFAQSVSGVPKSKSGGISMQ